MANDNKKTAGKQRLGTLFVISAPSGAGKSTLCHQLLHKLRGLKLSVSYTTRPPRKGERNDVDYTFITQKKFKNMISSGEFAEWAMVHGNLYGTSLKRLKKLTKEGYDIILDIDVQGAMQIKKKCDNAVYIFIFPPSMRTLKQRLLNRGTDSKDIVDRRLEKARAEITGYKNYDYVIINDKLEKAYKELEGIIVSNRLKAENISDKQIKSLIK